MSSGWKFEVIQKTLQEDDNQLSVSMLCDIAGVSRSGYYRWINAAGVREQREIKDQEDFELILKAYNQRGYSKGARGIYVYAALESAGYNEFEENPPIDGQIWLEVPYTKG